MSESVLKSILEESARLEWAKYDKAPKHIFSKEHEQSMKRVFKLFEKNKCKLKSYEAYKQHFRIRFTKKTALVLLTIIFLAVLAGCTVVYYVSHSFKGSVHTDNTEIKVIDTENCPSVIKEKYYLSELSEDFEVTDSISTPFYEYTSYQNKKNNSEQTIVFRQYVKTDLGSIHFNTEGQDLEEVEVNGHYGLCLVFSSDGFVFSDVIWDNGDYILELSGDFDKNALFNLAKSAKLHKK